MPPHPWEWDDSNASQALDRFDEMQGPLARRAFRQRSPKLQLHVDFARQHPLFVCEHEQGVAFAHSLWRVVELMRTMGWPVEPDPKASALLVAMARFWEREPWSWACPSSCRATPSNGRPRVLPSARVDLTSNRHVLTCPRPSSWSTVPSWRRCNPWSPPTRRTAAHRSTC